MPVRTRWGSPTRGKTSAKVCSAWLKELDQTSSEIAARAPLALNGGSAGSEVCKVISCKGMHKNGVSKGCVYLPLLGQRLHRHSLR